MLIRPSLGRCECLNSGTLCASTKGEEDVDETDFCSLAIKATVSVFVYVFSVIMYWFISFNSKAEVKPSTMSKGTVELVQQQTLNIGIMALFSIDFQDFCVIDSVFVSQFISRDILVIMQLANFV